MLLSIEKPIWFTVLPSDTEQGCASRSCKYLYYAIKFNLSDVGGFNLETLTMCIVYMYIYCIYYI